jgi:hypothetical protein
VATDPIVKREAADPSAVKRMLEPEEVADPILFLVSQRASGVTGSGSQSIAGYRGLPLSKAGKHSLPLSPEAYRAKRQRLRTAPATFILKLACPSANALPNSRSSGLFQA